MRLQSIVTSVPQNFPWISIRIPKGFALFLILLFNVSVAKGQVDGFLAGDGNTELAISYSHESFSSFWMGSNYIGRDWNYVTQSAAIYAAYGISKNIDVIANIPYVTASVMENKVRSFQDASLFLNYRPIRMNIEELGNLSLIGSLGFQVPLSKYENNEMLAIGHRTFNTDMRVVTQFTMNNGFFVTGQAGYIVKSGATPNSIPMQFKTGYSHKHFYVDAFVDKQLTVGGGNLGETDFYKTGISYCKIGFSAYAPIVKGLGVSVGTGITVSGKNTGKAKRVSGGVVYTLAKKQQEEQTGEDL